MSLATGVSFTHLPDEARAEFAAETDINLQLQRFGVGTVGGLRYGEEDYDLDLLAARTAVADARRALSRLPADVLEKFGGPDGAMIAVATGDLTPDDLKPKPEPVVVPTPPAKASPEASVAP